MSSEHEKVNLENLLDIIKEVGGWHLTGILDKSHNFDSRVQKLQNGYGVDVFFTWGVIEQEGKNKLAIVAGGWNDALLGLFHMLE